MRRQRKNKNLKNRIKKRVVYSSSSSSSSRSRSSNSQSSSSRSSSSSSSENVNQKIYKKSQKNRNNGKKGKHQINSQHLYGYNPVDLKKYLALEKMIQINEGSLALNSIEELEKLKSKKIPQGYGPVYSIETDRQSEYLYLRKTTFQQFKANINPEYFKRYLIHIYTLGGGLVEPGNPINGLYHDKTRNNITIEWRSIEECFAAFNLYGIIYGGRTITVKRTSSKSIKTKCVGTRPTPKFNKEFISSLKSSPSVDEGSEKLKISNLPEEADEALVIQELCKYGQVNQFYLERNPSTQLCTGIAYFKFIYPNFSTSILKSRIIICNRVVSISRAGSQQTSFDDFNYKIPKKQSLLNNNIEDDLAALDEIGKGMQVERNRIDKLNILNNDSNTILVGTRQVSIDPEEKTTTIVVLENAVNPQTLETVNEFFQVSSDMEMQLSKFGTVENVKILRKSEGYSKAGNILAKFDKLEAAILAKNTLNGLKYVGRLIKASYFNENKYTNGIYE